MFTSSHTMYYACSLYESHELNRLKRVFVVGKIRNKILCIYIVIY